MPGRIWTTEETARLVEMKNASCATAEIAAELGRSIDAVAGKASQLQVRRTPVPADIRFWKHVDRRGDDECWPWTGARDRKGYGAFNWMGVRGGLRHRLSAPRYAWLLAHGEEPGESWVLHGCDNPACVNPRHLFLGDYSENNADAKAKRRHAHGERHGFAKLNDEKVRESRRLLASGLSRRAVAARFGVCAQTMDALANGRTWKHV